MSATVLSFPTMWERDQAEFDRKGVSNFTRASNDVRSCWTKP